MTFAVRLVAALVCAAGLLSANQAADAFRAIKGLELDADRCYRVRDIFLQREDVKFFFTDGHIIFAKPALERTLGALFVASEPADIGEVLVVPPDSAERQSAARFLGETILNEKFRNAMLFFTDDTADVLLDAIENSSGSSEDLEEGARIASRWSIVMRHLIAASAPRSLLDVYSGRSEKDGFFVAAIRGRSLGRFDIVVDPMLDEQISAGQLVRSDGRVFYETWTRFQSRSVREGHRQPPTLRAELTDYAIRTTLSSDLHMTVNVTAKLALLRDGLQAVGFEISDRLEVTAIRVSGEPVEFVQDRMGNAEAPRGGQASLVVAFLPEELAALPTQPIEFEYRGKVVSDAGSGVYFVSDRSTWYPRAGGVQSHYELEFRYPPDLDVVATGTRFYDDVGDGVRVSRFRSGKPIRQAGFNVGNFATASREVQGFQVEVKATKAVEERLRASRAPVMMPPTTLPTRRRGRIVPAPILVLPAPPTENPAAGVERIADQSAAAFAFFLRRFGEPAMPETVISPVPADFGQGFPGLVYASTLSYFRRGDRPLRSLTPSNQRFYAEMLLPHEIAHQWWGNLVSVDSDRDAWLMEALATYSSLLWMEEKHGAAERDSILSVYLQNLLRRTDGATVESSGPIILGHRLRTSKHPDAHRTVVYQKGAWILHMLRGILGHDGFFEMLRALIDLENAASLTTEAFRQHAAAWAPEGHSDSDLRDFFDQWVFGTGIPRIEADWKQVARGARHHFELRLILSGVPDHFSLEVPVEVHTSPGRSLVKTVQTGETDDDPGFSVVLRNAASRVVVDPERWLLAERR